MMPREHTPRDPAEETDQPPEVSPRCDDPSDGPTGSGIGPPSDEDRIHVIRPEGSGCFGGQISLDDPSTFPSLEGSRYRYSGAMATVVFPEDASLREVSSAGAVCTSRTASWQLSPQGEELRHIRARCC